MKPGQTMSELHSNFTFQGSKKTEGGVLPTNHTWHETVEITHGLNDWFETGVYLFTAAQDSYGFQYVGSHIRPRARIPAAWKWPVGVSLSAEAGYQRSQFSADTWTLELRPIIDKELGRWSFLSTQRSIVPSTAPVFMADSCSQPNFKFSYDVTKKVKAGLEYYGSLGPIIGFAQIGEQQQQIVPAIDLDLSEDWEFNFGVGVGVTHGTDQLLVKMIIGRRFNFGHKH